MQVYQPTIRHADIYFPQPGVKPHLKYNHDVDIVWFKGRFLAAWNANESSGEDVPGQYNFLSVSDDFEHWSTPVRLFTADADCDNPVESDNQWQPSFIDPDGDLLFCNWCDYNARRTFISTSHDGLHWTNQDVPPAPPALAGQVVGFPTNHGLRTKAGTLVFPCSLPFVEDKCIVGHTRYAGLLLSFDDGQNWERSEPIEGVSWSSLGENPDDHGGEIIYLWEPSVFEQPDGRLGLLVRNSTSQDNPERLDQPHHMLLYATSADQGRTWTKCRPVEVDTIISRNYSICGAAGGSDLLMVMNDWWCNIPERISHDRYFLSLFCAPVCQPDLLLPGPVIQPEGGVAFYPNGMVRDGKLYLAYTYPGGIHSSVVEELPDFSEPFLLPRGGRCGLRLDADVATFATPQSSLGLVLTEALTRQPELRLSFDFSVGRYQGGHWPLLTVGGKTREGFVLRARYSAEAEADLLEVGLAGGGWTTLGPFSLKQWHRAEVLLTETGFGIRIDSDNPRSFAAPVLRKICFGGLYAKPEWPMGRQRAMEVRVRLSTLAVG